MTDEQTPDQSDQSDRESDETRAKREEIKAAHQETQRKLDEAAEQRQEQSTPGKLTRRRHDPDEILFYVMLAVMAAVLWIIWRL